MNKKLNWLTGQSPHLALAELHRSGDLRILLPEVDALYGVPQNPEHHPEVDTGIHTEMCLQMAERLGADDNVRFAVLMHDLGKALTPKDELPKHILHEVRGIAPVKAVCDRFQVSDYTRELALLVCEHHLLAHTLFIMRSKKILEYFDKWGFLQRPELLKDFVLACEADKRGRLNKTEAPYLQGPALLKLYAELRKIPVPANTSLTVREGSEYHSNRLTTVRAVMKEFKPQK